LKFRNYGISKITELYITERKEMSTGFGFTPYCVNDPGARAAANSANQSASEAKSEVGELRAEIDRLLMVTEALWTILKEEHNLDENKLGDYIREIDLRDGRLDGRVAKTSGPAECPSCQRKLSRRHYKCIYCGAEVTPDTFG
jgi:hypothetical protein